MELDFVKMHGLGNDFVFIDDLSEEVDLSEDQVKFICNRHFGIGADGVILVRPPKRGGLAYMHYINSDGSLAQMCGNGVRCFAKYLVDRGFVADGDDVLVAETLAGLRDITFRTNGEGKLVEATVNMGAPILEPDQVPISLAASSTLEDGWACVLDASLPSPWGEFAFSAVSMGNPHAICFVDDWVALSDELFSDPSMKCLDTFKVDTIGSFYESDPVFPECANIEFAEVLPDRIRMRVYERGCGETLACGTGTCATSVAATLTGRAGASNDVELLGGMLHIDWDADGKVFMTGPAEEAFSGTIEL